MKLIWERERERFEALSEYSEKDIPKGAGFRWDPGLKRWWTDDKIKASRLANYAEGRVKTRLLEIANEADQAVKMSQASNANIDIPAPDGLEYMPFQKGGIAYAMKRDSVLIADEMGLGKTIQALGIINADESLKKILVIVPASLRLNWKQEAQKWLVRPMSINVMDSKADPDTSADVVIINYDILSKHHDFLRSRIWDCMIVDESHYLKNNKALRTKQVLGHKVWNKKKRVEEIKVDPIQTRRKIFLTGTPIVNRPIEIQPVLASISPEHYGNFFGFAKRYCNAHRNRYGWDVSGASNLEELQQGLRERCMVRRLKSQVLTELPSKRRAVIEFPVNGTAKVVKDEKEAYAQFEDQLNDLRAAVALAKVSDNKSDYDEAVLALKEAAQAAFVEMARLRKATAVEKAPLVSGHVRDVVEETGNKVVVFAHHHEVIDLLVEELNDLGVVKLDGRDSMKVRDDAVNSFQKDESVKVFIGGIKAAGVGLTLTESSHVIFAELDWVPGNMSQAEDRCHRIGQANQVLVQHLVLEESLDARMALAIIDKQEVIDRALDRGYEHEPVLPMATSEPVTIRREKIEKEASKMNETEIQQIHDDLRRLAGVCDGAVELDGMGFNGVDTRIGHSLAHQSSLTSKQAALGKKILHKYRKTQLGYAA